MEPIQIPCTVISPMFSYGNGQAEPRATELKGLMRYVWRISMLETDSKELYRKETVLFGGAVQDKQGGQTLYASPVRLQMRLISGKTAFERLVTYKSSTAMAVYPPGTKFDIGLSLRPNLPEQSKPLEWYQNIFWLSLVLGGIGKRSRRGRGCMTAAELENLPRNELPRWVAQGLNTINDSEELFQFSVNAIAVNAEWKNHVKDVKRPVIEKILFGEKIGGAGVFLQAVDEASHTLKKNYRCPKGEFATGFVKAHSPDRMASSVIVSLVKIKDGLFPVYTFLKPVFSNHFLDEHEEERTTFLKTIAEEMRKE